ncbi:MAG: hypothetical protein GY873_30340 [Bosea sp.]|uniref:hypothetical protein n=1 Tax=Bosea sp. (in: a-proteobacteria) TaxID=1871050 RepID=UPI0023877E4C|nr:hypothetical protein [Bosea sp. (in: a-proteobacteria)]MCP4738496.1 hypothetical protein [Bosea sp. (in: a-proteobacteria)]
MSRIRKAWRLTSEHWDDSATAYAETGSKALYRLYVEADSSATFAQFLKRVRVRRDAGRDIILPDRHPLAEQLSREVLSCVVHAYGGRGLKAGNRDHFFTSERSPAPKAAYYHGLFEMHRAPEWYAGSKDMISYRLTDLGQNVARGEAETYPDF